MHIVGFYYKNISRCTVVWMSNDTGVSYFGNTPTYTSHVSYSIVQRTSWCSTWTFGATWWGKKLLQSLLPEYEFGLDKFKLQI